MRKECERIAIFWFLGLVPLKPASDQPQTSPRPLNPRATLTAGLVLRLLGAALLLLLEGWDCQQAVVRVVQGGEICVSMLLGSELLGEGRLGLHVVVDDSRTVAAHCWLR